MTNDHRRLLMLRDGYGGRHGNGHASVTYVGEWSSCTTNSVDMRHDLPSVCLWSVPRPSPCCCLSCTSACSRCDAVAFYRSMQRAIASVCCLSVRPSVTFMYRRRIGWVTWKVSTLIISLGYSLFWTPTHYCRFLHLMSNQLAYFLTARIWPVVYHLLN